MCEDSAVLTEGKLFKREAHPLGSSESRAKIALSLTHPLYLQIFYIEVGSAYLKAIL